MSIINIQSGMNSFNHNYLVSNRKKSKKADEHEGTMLNGDGLVGYNIDLLNGREHLTIENLNHEIIGAESNLSLVQTAACALQSLENQLSRISNFVKEIADSEDINLAMKKGVNYPIGPLEWGELWGHKNVVETLENLFHEYGERYRVSTWLKQRAKIC